MASAAPLRRVVCLVADGFGVGALPDAEAYGDVGANTLGHCAAAVGKLRLPALEKLGLGTLTPTEGVADVEPLGCAARLAERSSGKDTTTGHWELAGLVTEVPFATFPDGFPAAIVDAWVRECGFPGALANCAASGTEIIERFGAESVATGKPILYTSADSVFQIAAHEDLFGLERLYKVCEIARRLLAPHQVGRVIARPFLGDAATGFHRTEHRRDFSVSPGYNLLDALTTSSIPVYSVGKIDDIFAHRGICAGNHTGNNRDGLAATLSFLEKARGERAFVFSNLVDFDQLYGHRRDVKGYARCLEQLDDYLPRILKELEPGDLLLLTSDHGCDPTYRGSDHTREYVPLLAYGPSFRGGRLGDRDSFADFAATILDGFGVRDEKLPLVGSSIFPFLQGASE